MPHKDFYKLNQELVRTQQESPKHSGFSFKSLSKKKYENHKGVPRLNIYDNIATLDCRI